MASLDDIWDAPVTPNSPKTPRQLDLDDEDVLLQPPVKRQRQALFLSDSEDDDQPSASVRRDAVKAPPPLVDPPIDEDVEALFADAENDEQLSFKRIGDLDIAAMEKEAEERHRRAMPLAPHPVVPSSSPARDGEATGATNGVKGKEKEPIKRRKPLVLNENLLLGPTGFPDLISELKDFKVKGKGHEVEDLTRLMRVYNFWAHRLYPKVKFRDTVIRVEKLCHSKRMHVALSVWRDEANGKVRDLDADLSLDSDDDDREPANVNQDHDQVQPIEGLPRPRPEVNNSSVPPSPRTSSQPPTNGFRNDGDLFDPPTSRSIGNTRTVTTSTSTPANRRTIVDDDDDEENLWKQLEAAKTQQLAQSQQQPTSMQFSGDLDDEEMWAALDEASTSIKPATEINSAVAGEMDIDDDDIWDIVKENEKIPPLSSSGGEEPNPTIPIHANQSLSESEMGWDDMYAD